MKYKIITQSFKADNKNARWYPRFWLNKANNPNFKHWSFTVRFLWWYIGVQKIWKN